MNFTHTAAILSRRYARCLTGDAGGLFILLLQAPLIGYLCTVVWASVEKDTDTLRFILALTAVWFGCINACREIVKERHIVERERLFGLSMPAYVLSKATVLGGLSLVQVILLQGVVEWRLGLQGAMLVQMTVLLLAAFSGIALGLLVSAVSSTQERAVFAVPLLILPQILFSEMALPKSTFTDVVKTVERVMPVRWAFVAFQETAATEPDWWTVIGAVVVLVGMAMGLLLLTMAALVRRQER